MTQSRTAKLLDKYLDGHHVFVDESQHAGLVNGVPMLPVLYIPRDPHDPRPWVETSGDFRWLSRCLDSVPAAILTGGTQLTIPMGDQQ